VPPRQQDSEKLRAEYNKNGKIYEGGGESSSVISTQREVRRKKGPPIGDQELRGSNRLTRERWEKGTWRNAFEGDRSFLLDIEEIVVKLMSRGRNDPRGG